MVGNVLCLHLHLIKHLTHSCMKDHQSAGYRPWMTLISLEINYVTKDFSSICTCAWILSMLVDKSYQAASWQPCEPLLIGLRNKNVWKMLSYAVTPVVYAIMWVFEGITQSVLMFQSSFTFQRYLASDKSILRVALCSWLSVSIWPNSLHWTAGIRLLWLLTS